jgi:hypothetical protein
MRTGSFMRCPSSLREYAGSGVTYAGKRHQWRKRHLSAPPSKSRTEPVMRAGAHSGHGGRAARDVIYVIYEENDIYAL